MRLCLDSVFQDSHSLGFMKVRVKSLIYGTYYSCLCEVAVLARFHMNGSIHFDRTIQKKKQQKQRP